MNKNQILASAQTKQHESPRQLPRQLLVRLQNVAHRANSHYITKPVARFIEILIRLVWTANLPAAASIDATAHFGHNGLGVIVNKNCEIASNCFIGSHVVMGGKAPFPGVPKLEKNVSVHAGAKLIGAIVIGEGSVIGANAVVTKSMPAFSLAMGIPARITKTDINPKDYR